MTEARAHYHKVSPDVLRLLNMVGEMVVLSLAITNGPRVAALLRAAEKHRRKCRRLSHTRCIVVEDD